RARLPAPLVPARYLTLPALPLGANGKVDRRALARLAVRAAAAGESAAAAAPGRAPSGDLETALAAIWRQGLGVAPGAAGGGFFALGGHSLSAIRAVSRVRAAFGIELPLARLFAAPSLAAQASLVAAALAGAAEGTPRDPHPAPVRVPRARRPAPLPLSF